MDDFSDLQPHLRRTTSDPDFESDPVPLPPEPEVDADSDDGRGGQPLPAELARRGVDALLEACEKHGEGRLLA